MYSVHSYEQSEQLVANLVDQHCCHDVTGITQCNISIHDTRQLSRSKDMDIPGDNGDLIMKCKLLEGRGHVLGNTLAKSKGFLRDIHDGCCDRRRFLVNGENMSLTRIHRRIAGVGRDRHLFR